MSEENKKEEKQADSKEHTVGYRLGQVSAMVVVYCVMAIIVALTAGGIIKFFQWLF